MSLFSVKEVAEKIGVAENTVASTFWRQRHGLKSFHIGRRVLFEEEEVVRFIEEKKAKEGQFGRE